MQTMRKLSMDELNRVAPEAAAQAPRMPVVIVLDNVRSMHNVGSIFRTADAFVCQKIYLCGYTPCPPHRDIQKSALGATNTVPWTYESNVEALLQRLAAEGYTLWAVEQATGSTLLPHLGAVPLATPLAVVFGNEVEGVQDAALTHCSGAIEIPQSGTKHSLNVSVAAGIVLYKLYEHLRQFTV
jgi:tRNA G18 (ribose-2'-O)-methylase SpoU